MELRRQTTFVKEFYEHIDKPIWANTGKVKDYDMVKGLVSVSFTVPEECLVLFGRYECSFNFTVGSIQLNWFIPFEMVYDTLFLWKNTTLLTYSYNHNKFIVPIPGSIISYHCTYRDCPSTRGVLKFEAIIKLPEMVYDYTNPDRKGELNLMEDNVLKWLTLSEHDNNYQQVVQPQHFNPTITSQFG